MTKKPQIPSCYNPVGWCSYSFPYKPHAPCILILCLPLGPQSPLLDPLSLVTPWTKRERVKTQRITGHLLKARLLLIRPVLYPMLIKECWKMSFSYWPRRRSQVGWGSSQTLLQLPISQNLVSIKTRKKINKRMY